MGITTWLANLSPWIDWIAILIAVCLFVYGATSNKDDDESHVKAAYGLAFILILGGILALVMHYGVVMTRPQ